MDTSPDNSNSAADLRSGYNFSELREVARGKYAAKYRECLRTVRLAKDVAGAVPDEAAVNAALREYLQGRQEPKAT